MMILIAFLFLCVMGPQSPHLLVEPLQQTLGGKKHKFWEYLCFCQLSFTFYYCFIMFLIIVYANCWSINYWCYASDQVVKQHSHLIKWQYYLKGINKDVRNYIANCTLCCREKVKVQSYPLQMTELLEQPFHKIVIDLVIECETSTSGNKHVLTIIDHLTG